MRAAGAGLGRIRWHGREITGQPKNVGYMLQKDLLLPWRTALSNTMLGLEIRGVATGEAEQRSRAMLDQLGLHGFADHYPSTLSGGMRQRVALARTLVNEPDVLLLDEPFASLDFQNKLLIESDTAKLVRTGGRSLLLITHDIEEAVSLADRVIVLSKRPTRVKAVYDIALGADRTDMMAARESRDFTQLRSAHLGRSRRCAAVTVGRGQRRGPHRVFPAGSFFIEGPAVASSCARPPLF